ncbi:hypothetical protein CC86DRAFT_199705 [Ophiobolus disseminans]|uniref:Uncharacterized protein n=1 Tax=Ophiobolus disseminans TaxID=1469910 RepID=A0A6A7A6I9_9PLEO|nr:hypothetical protein CC86DRAFT_199705 [Ophiobolus disseminans]
MVTTTSALPANSQPTSTHGAPPATPSPNHPGPSPAANTASVAGCSRNASHWAWARLRRSAGVATTPLRVVFRSFDKITSIFGLAFTVVFGAIGFVAIKTAVWTSRKDWYLYCLEQEKQLEDLKLHKCNGALKAGLPPPPFSNFKRGAQDIAPMMLRKRSWTGQQLPGVHQPHSPGFPEEDTMITRVGTGVLLAVIVFLGIVLSLALMRRAWLRIRIVAATSHSTDLQALYKLVVGLLVLFLMTVGMIFMAREVGHAVEQADLHFATYCRSEATVCPAKREMDHDLN